MRLIRRGPRGAGLAALAGACGSGLLGVGGLLLALTLVAVWSTPPGWAEPAPAPAATVSVAVVDCGLPDSVEAPLSVAARANLAAGPARPDKCTHGALMVNAILEGFTAAGPLGQPATVQLLDVRVIPDDGRGDMVDLIRGVRWAARSGAQVVNLSLSTPHPCVGELRDAIADVGAHGGLVVAATGNDGASVLTAPASCPGVLPVTAVMNGEVPAFATRSPDVLLAAPPLGVWRINFTAATLAGDSPAQLQVGSPQAGTSWSSAYTSGVAARMLAASPDLTAAGVRAVLVGSSAPLAHPSGATRQVDARQALALVGQRPQPLTGAPTLPDPLATDAHPVPESLETGGSVLVSAPVALPETRGDPPADDLADQD